MIDRIFSLPALIAGYAVLVVVAIAGLAFLLVFAVRLLTTPAIACDPYVQDCTVAPAQQIAPSDKKLSARIVGSRPRGCPHRHCGCSLALKIFGKIIPRLNLAANWLRFPRTSPAPGMVAARRGHVMQLLSHVNGSKWRVYDPNSGGGLTRIHVRSIAGFVVVDPKPSMLARLGGDS